MLRARVFQRIPLGKKWKVGFGYINVGALNDFGTVLHERIHHGAGQNWAGKTAGQCAEKSVEEVGDRRPREAFGSCCTDVDLEGTGQ